MWEEKSAAIQYADYSFIMTRHQLKQDVTLPHDASASDVSSNTADADAAAALMADAKPTLQQTDEDDSCKACMLCAYLISV